MHDPAHELQESRSLFYSLLMGSRHGPPEMFGRDLATGRQRPLPLKPDLRPAWPVLVLVCASGKRADDSDG